MSPPLFRDGGYLFVTFNGEATPMTEQIHFGLSRDGRHWQALNGGKPVLVSELGEKGVRDPFIIRSPKGGMIYLLATDLSINQDPDWNRAVSSGSRSIVIWNSEDLVHWSQPRLVAVAAEDAGCAWAPEAVYDEASGDFLVFWASKNRRDDFAKHRIWASRTKDFTTFDEPFVYVDNPKDVIDTTIVRDGESYYRFSKDEMTKAITLETSERLMGPWRNVPGFSLADLCGYEGPACFSLGPGPAGRTAWCLLLDYYSKGEGYQAYLTNDLAGGHFEPAADFSLPFRFRHGSVLPITAAEHQRLEAAFG